MRVVNGVRGLNVVVCQNLPVLELLSLGDDKTGRTRVGKRSHLDTQRPRTCSTRFTNIDGYGMGLHLTEFHLPAKQRRRVVEHSGMTPLFFDTKHAHADMLLVHLRTDCEKLDKCSSPRTERTMTKQCSGGRFPFPKGSSSRCREGRLLRPSFPAQDLDGTKRKTRE